MVLAAGPKPADRGALVNVRFTPYPDETFLGRRAERDSAIMSEFSARGACAEKRVSFRGVLKRHLSVI